MVETRVYSTFIMQFQTWRFKRFICFGIYLYEKTGEKKLQSRTLSELMRRIRVANVYHGKQLLIHKHPKRLQKIKTSLGFTLTLCVHQASYLLTWDLFWSFHLSHYFNEYFWKSHIKIKKCLNIIYMQFWQMLEESLNNSFWLFGRYQLFCRTITHVHKGNI